MEQHQQHAEGWPDDEVPARPGYRFAPTPRELIHYYLNPWVTNPGETPFGEPEGIVCAADVYSADPGTLTSRLRDFGHDDGNWYFLCVTRWKDGNAGTRMSRAVQGGGKWHGSGKRIAVPRYGYRQTFEYRDAAGGKGAWLMEEFGSRLPEATGNEGVRVLCRVHRKPRAAADGDDGEERQESGGVVEFPSSKRLRRALRQGHGSAAAGYWTAPAPPDVGCSYASTSQAALANWAAPLTTWQQQQQQQQQQPAPPDVGCSSYASTSQAALANWAAPSTTWQQQQQQPPPPPMTTEQTVGYYCAGVNGGEDVKEEPAPLEMLPPDMGWQQFAEMGYGFEYSAEAAQLNEWMTHSTFSCPKPCDDTAQENDDSRGQNTAAS